MASSHRERTLLSTIALSSGIPLPLDLHTQPLLAELFPFGDVCCISFRPALGLGIAFGNAACIAISMEGITSPPLTAAAAVPSAGIGLCAEGLGVLVVAASVSSWSMTGSLPAAFLVGGMPSRLAILFDLGLGLASASSPTSSSSGTGGAGRGGARHLFA